jgi:histidinol-phosphatase (PHP family)
LPRYFEAVAEARAAFPALNIKLGLECDFIAGQEKWIERLAGMADWDYFIGSVHYLPEGWDVDNPKYLSRHSGTASEEIWAEYWKTYHNCIESGLFDFVAHPDLPKKFGFRPDGDLRRFYEPAVEALARAGIAFEVNTAGLRKDCAEQYPAAEFIGLARKANVPLVISSGAHKPGEVGLGFDTALGLVKAAGYSETARFTRRTRTSAALQ